MARPRFSEALVQRRRELGLTTAQASRVLKLKEHVLVALEEGDFESIPKSGYAQGMVSSYARYLGLDAREMVGLFQEDLAEYEAATVVPEKPSSESRVAQHIRLTTQRQTVDDSRRSLLPTSGGRAGDVSGFTTTSDAQTRSGSVPLVNPYRMRSTGSYGSYSANDDDEDVDSGITVRSRRQSSLASREQPRRSASYQSKNRSLTGERITRTRAYDTYQDDLAPRTATSFEPASSAEGRRKSHRIAQTERPNTADRRRNSKASRSRERRSNTSTLDGILAFISESRVIIGIAALVIILLLVIAIFMGIQSCTRGQAQSAPESVPVSTVTGTDSGTIPEGGESQGEGNQLNGGETGQAANPSQQGGEAAASGEPINAEGTQSAQNLGETISTEVTISVASGESTWLEVMADGESRVADQVLGPWSETYVVSESLKVQADNTGAVSVFENGQSRTFETRASGVGSITIKVPVATPQPEAETTVVSDTTGGF